MKILNLYAGIGGNRKLWGDKHKVTNVEYNLKIANILKDLYPNDEIIVGDAHQYLLDHYKEYDFIWSSPPCPSHSIIRKNSHSMVNYKIKAIFPDMKLYEEIILLKYYFKGKFVVENVKSYYDPLIKPQENNRHYFWSNFIISKIDLPSQDITTINKNDTVFGINIGNYNLDKDYNHVKVLRNMVNPKLGLHIFECAFKKIQNTLN